MPEAFKGAVCLQVYMSPQLGSLQALAVHVNLEADHVIQAQRA